MALASRPGQEPCQQQSHFTCQKCGKNRTSSNRSSPRNHTAPVAAYALQCHCPQCDAEGYNYNGRYFKPIEPGDVKRLILAEREWADRNEADLNDYWPRSEFFQLYMTPQTQRWNLQSWGYTHWWKMFNPRQLLVHTQLFAPSPKPRRSNGRWMCGSRPWVRCSSICGIRTCSCFGIRLQTRWSP